MDNVQVCDSYIKTAWSYVFASLYVLTAVLLS
jgi:hypothetical protein